MCNIHIAFPELQAVVLCLSGKFVALHLDNITDKADLSDQIGRVSQFLSILACCLLNLANKHAVTLIPANKLTHLNVETDYLLQGRMILEWHLLPVIDQVAFQLWD